MLVQIIILIKALQLSSNLIVMPIFTFLILYLIDVYPKTIVSPNKAKN